MNKEQFAPCPFCGKSDTLTIGKASDAFSELDDCGDPLPYMHTESYSVVCDSSKPDGPGGCGASGGYFPSEHEAVAAWNRRAEVGRLAAQSAPTEIHADTPRHELLPRLRRLASDFQSHPLSRSISECEEAGIAMAEAAKQIEMLCRTRNTVVNHSGRMRKEIAALTEHRDFLLREMAKIDGDPGNACHYAIEAISAVCADLAEPVPPLPEPSSTAYIQGHSGGEYRTLSDSYEPDCAMFSPQQMHAYIDADRAQRPDREVRLLTSKDIDDVRKTLWRDAQMNLSDLHAEDAAKAFQRKFCEVNGLTVKDQS